MAKKELAIPDLIFLLALLVAFIKEKRGELTGDDLDVVDGIRDILVGRLQERHGWEREHAARQADIYITDGVARGY
jgi:uncharacterized protein YjbJ (UPF0337 family)